MAPPPADTAYRHNTLDMFMFGIGREFEEIDEFNAWKAAVNADNVYPFEAVRAEAQRPHLSLRRETGEQFDALSFANFNYLGLGYHPEVIKAAQNAIGRYGIGAFATPTLAGTLAIHKELEQALVDFYGLPDRGITLFSSGYGANVGSIQALVQRGHHVVMDQLVHMSILDGAKTSGAKLHFFEHNDADSLEAILKPLSGQGNRILVCAEGVYSADGDFGRLAQLTEVAHRHGAHILVDEAHSVMLCGKKGRGVCDQAGVIDQVDFIIATLSKGFAGVGGALIASRKVTEYVNWYARCRLFSTAMDPGTAGGLIKVIELGSGSEGDNLRARLHHNSQRLRDALSPHVDLGASESWIVPVIYGPDHMTFEIVDHLQRHGLDVSLMQFPSTPKDKARLRLFANAAHSDADIDFAVTTILDAARRFNFLKADA
ncbi:aminotransferase class I/II-fold pyridoxal phosphate-dependent enzyme [Asticcacaulis sp. BYS171W]|uniref:Aminotransferase class I/II-fold pyridoxal phosphate-dependent enzyme n=1 Tax=Asticcacaulis aquaticus TaxID=2984212 RepID=A0ABT5HUH7_9CAUL|nr:aminotransferase class I/II-fold pyridoxal phosphate-dependent enzyme [Asticcacaulis aquaticus]MDC7683732.1 aminotransferase class I/II-fold pyridoxal phosphate-dependent enzyme [Asticcacaulis aquaticus]